MATTFTYTPIVGFNQVVALAGVPQILNGAPTLIAKDTDQGDGRHGKTKIAFILNNPDGSTAGDTVVNLSVHCPIPFPRDTDPASPDFGDVILPATDHAAYFPVCTVTPRTHPDNAFPAAAINCNITAGEATIDGQVPISIAFTATGGGLGVSYNVEIDFCHSATN